MFCGTSRRRRTPMNVCLHTEQTQAAAVDVAYDVDNFQGFGDSPALAKKGLWVQPVSQMRQNMTADDHIETNVFHTTEDVERPGRSSSSMLRDVPHFLFGRVVGAHDITEHVLFPHMAVTGEKFECLTKDRWHAGWMRSSYRRCINTTTRITHSICTRATAMPLPIPRPIKWKVVWWKRPAIKHSSRSAIISSWRASKR